MSPRKGLDLNDILQAAEEIANTKGVHSVTLASVAKKLGIRSPSLYNHIDGLQDLLNKLAIFGYDELYESMVNAAIGVYGDEAIKRMGKVYITFARNRPGLYEATFYASGQQDDDIQMAGFKIVELFVQVFKIKGFDDTKAIHIVRGLRSIFHGFASLEQKGEFGLPLDLDESYQIMIDTYLRGIETLTKESD